MKRATPFTSHIGAKPNPPTACSIDAVEKWRDGVPSVEEPTLNSVGGRWSASPVRLTLAGQLGNKIDGAWWLRTGLISRELTELVSILDARLGQVIDINVNWSSLQRQHDLNWDWGQGVRPHVMTVDGRDARAKLLIVPHRTGTALAVMVLRRAANLPVHAAHRNSRAFQTADCIVRVARGEQMFEVRRARRAAIPQGPQD
ncbi:DUF5994 family protein [Mycobacterium sp. 852002-30065_SCH5024008]|uniref:DUF5994 family protein n=1 Tax=Mycobacterium sp. 852002-30065_SCH5024008 TaxID=1834088 RepID=UPI001E3659CC|nr:DUF5994 family protein [Mycobacterium sp. 852002-30065_SCH5024008]